jgi:hypothetical protein
LGHPPHPEKIYAGSLARVPLVPRKSNTSK